MVRIGKFPPRTAAPSQSPTTPYDMLTVKLGDNLLQARPFETATDPSTGQEYPSKAVTSCSECGHGIYVDITPHQAISHQQVSVVCENCGAGKAPVPEVLNDPFINPLTNGLIKRHELNPLYQDPSAPAPVVKPESAAKRISERRKSCPKPKETAVGEPVTTPRGQATNFVVVDEVVEKPVGLDDVLELGEEP